MKQLVLIGLWLLVIPVDYAGAVELNSEQLDPAYVQTIVTRSQKIVDDLNVENPEVREQVTRIIANRYFELNGIYEIRDSLLQIVEENNSLNSEEKSQQIQRIQQEKDARLYQTHFAFPANLSLYLNDEQIEKVKDGMTYGVVMVTYRSTLEMIPSLSSEEKDQILVWLKEAREFAMDAESSKKKHEVFGKYKGRINNYLSKRGYDLTREREAWYKRIEQKKLED